MRRISYYFFRLFIFIFSLIPFVVLYRLADLLYFVFYYLTKYRYKVIHNNIKNSFPNKSAAELKAIEKAAYRNICDVLVEGIKGLSMPKEKLLARYRFINPEVLDDIFASGRHAFAAASHFSNWEWGAITFGQQVKHHAIGIYKPLRNPHIEKFVKDGRSRQGVELVSMFDLKKSLVSNDDNPSVFILVTDQSPSNTQKAYWLDFLNQDTPCLHGLDNNAREHNIPIVYTEIKRVKRGHYEVRFSPLHFEPATAEPGEINRLYFERLEKTILENPGDWLWSHRRWKHKRKRVV